ncbi:tumor necrosis factor receptor superfamily member 18 [Macrotis lagotis]|uniref:tumor necrosis factor receptor superfamily member 18 n=1 Tax=Macrotis lagotis TaxID=92651 RepID=UPI003D69A16E
MGARAAWVVGAWWGVFLFCQQGEAQDQVPGRQQSTVPRCKPSQFQHQGPNDLRCCNACKSRTRPCPSFFLSNCTCAMPGTFCKDLECSSCIKHTCSPGQQVFIHGSFLFNFSCEDCEDGTYSDGIDGECLPWTNCARKGFLTVRPGNKTHNVLCGMAPLPVTGPFNSYDIPMAILTGFTIIIFILVIILLVLQILWVKKDPFTKDREPILPMEPGPPDDIGNCPFPEEEWGEKTTEDKGQISHPWI